MAQSPSVDIQEQSISDTVQSLVIAFVLAMAFRGFVLEGFIIPTGSMAPTLMGQHALLTSKATGAECRIDAGSQVQQMLQSRGTQGADLYDPMLSRIQPISKVTAAELAREQRAGDRVLIVKTLYPFFSPKRWDVVVFKNPTDPLGDTQNYIKRLLGLPNEKLLFIDGDLFAGPVSVPGLAQYKIQRKPEHVQRVVWQPVYHSEFLAVDPAAPQAPKQIPWHGEHWQTTGRRDFECDTPEPTILHWDNVLRPVNDWTTYNMITQQLSSVHTYAVSDLRVSASIVAQQTGLDTTLELRTRQHVFEFQVDSKTATVRMRRENEPDRWLHNTSSPIALPPPGRVFNVEFWHVDQSLAIYLDGKRVVDLEYNWSPQDRLEWTTGKRMEPMDQALTHLSNPGLYPPPQIQWSFRGSRLTLDHVHLDRDLYYQPIDLNPDLNPKPTHPDFVQLVTPGRPGYGTAPSTPAELDSDQFFMCGDNSPASHDSRAWRNPDPLVAAQIDPKPFVVNRRLLLGKAWMVYFPAPYRASADGPPIIPDFGRLRLIR